MLTFLTVAKVGPTAATAQAADITEYIRIIVPFAIIALWIGLGYLWNRRYRPMRLKAGKPIQTFNSIIGQIIAISFKEDTRPLFAPKKDDQKKKKQKPDDQKKPSNNAALKFATWRNFNRLALLVSIILIGLNVMVGVYIFIALIMIVTVRSNRVRDQRFKALMRMYEVAAVELKYPRNEGTNPWGWVDVKWDDLFTPGDINVRFPAAYKSEEVKNRENFERHFNGTVTDENTWTYKWVSAESVVKCSPVKHIPSMAPYPGSADREWNEIPIGIGVDGEIVWDIKKVPHALITGTSGAGKSTLQRNLIFHCIQHPDKIRFLGIDVKRVELKPYAKYNDVVVGIAVDVEEGVEICRFARDEMMDRYEKMEELEVNNFLLLPHPPHALVLMVDESYQFLAPRGIKTDEGKAEDELKGEASAILGDIARLGRAAGVHLVLATQRPDAKVIYGELKQNLAARIAAGRADSIASNMTLDNEQATRLPAIKGRGYCQFDGEGEQFQGYYAEETWIDKWLAGEISGHSAEQEHNPKKKKRGRKAKNEPVDNEPIDFNAVHELEEEIAQETPKTKRKGGLLAKIQAFNANQGQSVDSETPTNDEPSSNAPVKKTIFNKKPDIDSSTPSTDKSSSLFGDDKDFNFPEANENPLIPVTEEHDVEANLLKQLQDGADDSWVETNEDEEVFDNLPEVKVSRESVQPSVAKKNPFAFTEEDFDFDDDVVLSAPAVKPRPIQAPVSSVIAKKPVTTTEAVKSAVERPASVEAATPNPVVDKAVVAPVTAVTPVAKVTGLPKRPSLPAHPQLPTKS